MIRGFNVGLLLTVLLLTVCAAQAQQPTKMPRIGYLSAATPLAVVDRTEAIRQGLRELGYVEGKNIVFEWRYAEGKFDRLPALASSEADWTDDSAERAGASGSSYQMIVLSNEC